METRFNLVTQVYDKLQDTFFGERNNAFRNLWKVKALSSAQHYHGE